MTYISDYDGTVIEQPEPSTDWTPCIQCGIRTTNLDTLLCDTGCKPPKKGINNLGLDWQGQWVKDKNGIKRWVK